MIVSPEQFVVFTLFLVQVRLGAFAFDLLAGFSSLHCIFTSLCQCVLLRVFRTLCNQELLGLVFGQISAVVVQFDFDNVPELFEEILSVALFNVHNFVKLFILFQIVNQRIHTTFNDFSQFDLGRGKPRVSAHVGVVIFIFEEYEESLPR